MALSAREQDRTRNRTMVLGIDPSLEAEARQLGHRDAARHDLLLGIPANRSAFRRLLASFQKAIRKFADPMNVATSPFVGRKPIFDQSHFLGADHLLPRIRNDEGHTERDQHLSQRIGFQPRQH